LAGVCGQHRLSNKAGQYNSLFNELFDDKLSFAIDNIEIEYEHITTTWTSDYLENKKKNRKIKLCILFII
jgi:hypothetical protein